jgi:hypothetical protein
MDVVKIPTINDGPTHFKLLFDLWQRLKNEKSSVRMDFSSCKFLKQNAVAFLGGLIEHVRNNGGKVYIDVDSIPWRVRDNLEKNGFLTTYSDYYFPHEIDIGNTVPYRRDRDQNRVGLIDYLENEWLGRGWVSLDTRLKEEIICKVLEMYENAWEHANSVIGVYTCGQHFPNMSELKLTIVDFGVGIPFNVRKFLKNETLEAHKCIEWALEPGASTKASVDNVSRGLGFQVLIEYIQTKNKGRLQLLSENGYAVVHPRGKKTYRIDSSFKGTIVNITFQCDDNLMSA